LQRSHTAPRANNTRFVHQGLKSWSVITTGMRARSSPAITDGVRYRLGACTCATSGRQAASSPASARSAGADQIARGSWAS
jgi:hypothetical protein